MHNDGTQTEFQGNAVSCKQDNTKEGETLEWEHLHPTLQTLLPSGQGLTYVVTDFTLLPSEDFPGAAVRISITEKESAQT